MDETVQFDGVIERRRGPGALPQIRSDASIDPRDVARDRVCRYHPVARMSIGMR